MKLNKAKDGYWHHNHCVSKCIYHVVFCPKYRKPVLTKKVATELKKLIKSRQLDWNFSVIEMEVMPDHVHILFQCDPEIGANNLVAKIKGYTASQLRKQFLHLRTTLPCLWTRSRFIATVGSQSLEVVKSYVANQQERR